MSTPKPRYINLLTDFAFKRIFGNEEHKDLLIHFLNEVLSPEGKKIKDLRFKNNEQTIDNKEDRKVIFDFYCEDESGDQFIVEIQRNKLKNFRERMLYYASKVLVDQGQKVPWAYNLKPVYVIGIMDFSYSEKEIIEYYSLRGKSNNKVYSECLKIITIELGNFRKRVTELETNMDKWLFLMKDLYTLDEIPDTMRDHIYMKILSLAEYAALSKPEQVAYDQSLKNMRDHNAAMSYQKELGWEEGMKEGIEKGIEKGIEQGELKGRNETVKLFHKNGMSIDEIQRYTGLSLEEIEGIFG